MAIGFIPRFHVMKMKLGTGFLKVLRIVCALALIAAATFLYSRIFSVNSTTVALTYLLVVLAIATVWGLFEAVAASVFGVICFNYFFLPPVGTFTISDPQNWLALFVFLVTAVIASHLSSRAKERAEEAIQRQHELERLYALSRSLLLVDNPSELARQIALQVAQAFEPEGVAFLDRSTDRVYRAGPTDIPTDEHKLRDVAVQGTVWHDAASAITVMPISLGGGPSGAWPSRERRSLKPRNTRSPTSPPLRSSAPARRRRPATRKRCGKARSSSPRCLTRWRTSSKRRLLPSKRPLRQCSRMDRVIPLTRNSCAL